MEKLMRTFGAALLATSLMVTSAFAATPLAPGKPAGVQKAQISTNTVFIIAGVGLLGLGIGLAASGNSNQITGTSTSATTTGTSP
jgi:hypothetical protein